MNVQLTPHLIATNAPEVLRRATLMREAWHGVCASLANAVELDNLSRAPRLELAGAIPNGTHRIPQPQSQSGQNAQAAQAMYQQATGQLMCAANNWSALLATLAGTPQNSGEPE